MWYGCAALAYVHRGECRLISRNENPIQIISGVGRTSCHESVQLSYIFIRISTHLRWLVYMRVQMPEFSAKEQR